MKQNSKTKWYVVCAVGVIIAILSLFIKGDNDFQTQGYRFLLIPGMLIFFLGILMIGKHNRADETKRYWATHKEEK